jgi:uncharacterized protein YbbK (DUF523 family)
MSQPWLVSACLLGRHCRYDCSHKRNEAIVALAKRQKLIPVCPEELGGLPIPRPPSEISGGNGADVLAGKARVITKQGADVTPYFVKGANEVLKIAQAHNVKKAILKARSPSCGCDEIYDGTFSGKTRKGDGVTTALLKKHGVKIVGEESIP